jgi:hypothetical protein
MELIPMALPAILYYFRYAPIEVAVNLPEQVAKLKTGFLAP